MITLNRAIAIAAEAHAGQLDKGGQPYILHPLRVMLAQRDELHMVVAVLHDVPEDTSWTLSQLQKEGLAADQLYALDCLTRRNGESYVTFIDRVASSFIAVNVKLADLDDNMDLRRLRRSLTQEDRDRMKRYEAARARLRAAL